MAAVAKSDNCSGWVNADSGKLHAPKRLLPVEESS
jgi:hypothetical protein